MFASFVGNEELLSTETTEYCQPRKQQRKRSKHEDKLKTLIFDSDQENDDDAEEELPVLSYHWEAKRL